MPPTNINIKQLKNNKAAVEKLAGKIKAQIIAIGNNKCLNTALKSTSSFAFNAKIRATYISNINLATSED